MSFTAIVIDDEQDNREIISELLTLYGVDVKATGVNGKDAVELFKEHKPDVVFSDILMPNYDGIYALKHIREEDPKAIVAIISASIDQTTERLLQRYEPSAIIDKPMGEKRL